MSTWCGKKSNPLKLFAVLFSSRLEFQCKNSIIYVTIISTLNCLAVSFDKSHITKGNCFKLSNQRFYHDVRKYPFIPRIINICNSLPDFVVNVDSINIFKSRLDKYWINQDIVFDYTADLAGTGDRSEYLSSY